MKQENMTISRNEFDFIPAREVPARDEIFVCLEDKDEVNPDREEETLTWLVGRYSHPELGRDGIESLFTSYDRAEAIDKALEIINR